MKQLVRAIETKPAEERLESAISRLENLESDAGRTCKRLTHLNLTQIELEMSLNKMSAKAPEEEGASPSPEKTARNRLEDLESNLDRVSKAVAGLLAKEEGANHRSAGGSPEYRVTLSPPYRDFIPPASGEKSETGSSISTPDPAPGPTSDVSGRFLPPGSLPPRKTPQGRMREKQQQDYTQTVSRSRTRNRPDRHSSPCALEYEQSSIDSELRHPIDNRAQRQWLHQTQAQPVPGFEVTGK